jgi:hypothetical protein
MLAHGETLLKAAPAPGPVNVALQPMRLWPTKLVDGSQLPIWGVRHVHTHPTLDLALLITDGKSPFYQSIRSARWGANRDRRLGQHWGHPRLATTALKYRDAGQPVRATDSQPKLDAHPAPSLAGDAVAVRSRPDRYPGWPLTIGAAPAAQATAQFA